MNFVRGILDLKIRHSESDGRLRCMTQKPREIAPPDDMAMIVLAVAPPDHDTSMVVLVIAPKVSDGADCSAVPVIALPGISSHPIGNAIAATTIPKRQYRMIASWAFSCV